LKTIQQEGSGAESVISASDSSYTCDRESCYESYPEKYVIPIEVGDKREHWCPVCVETEFGLDSAMVDSGKKVTERYISLENIVVSLISISLTALVFSVLVV
jgi:uncharacterized Zn-finger protein